MSPEGAPQAQPRSGAIGSISGVLLCRTNTFYPITGRFLSTEHRCRNTNVKIGTGGWESRPETQRKRPKITKTNRNSRILPGLKRFPYQSHYRTSDGSSKIPGQIWLEVDSSKNIRTQGKQRKIRKPTETQRPTPSKIHTASNLQSIFSPFSPVGMCS